MPIIGEQIGELLQIWHLLELIEAVPAVVCALFVTPLTCQNMVARFTPTASM
jgi:hypothetical protein